ncbi:MAG: glycosyl hydrolase [Alphaproteobacteria bacterium]|nr:glycosyl hydrolase [Alphaproteobacteria bacterium]
MATSVEGIQASLLGSLDWRLIGPHRGGRVVAVAGCPADPATFYFGACAGGVWKTTDAGQTWLCTTDGFFRTAAVGAIAVAPSAPNVIYAGTGEACIRNDVSHGDGIYKSVDAGKTWTHLGLDDTRHIGRIVVHPANPELVYVAALGHAWGRNRQRGVFRSKDGGRTWENVLYKSDRAGSHDIALDPVNPNVLYAPIWQAQRYPHALISGGEECGLWRSADGGDTWTDISRSAGLPKGMLGKIGVAVSPEPVGGRGYGRVWALVEAEDGAMFRSDDGGRSFERASEFSGLRTRPWYYMHVTADPQDPDTVYVQNYRLWKSIDAGRTFLQVPTPHGDDHALWIDPKNPKRMIEGNDGGACVSFTGGQSWSSIYNQPTAQLYHVTTDDRFPYRVYASQQDNTAISIPSASPIGAITERDWIKPGGGESGYIAIKHDNPDLVVASGPIGRRSPNDVMYLFDHKTGQDWQNTVWPELYGWGVGAETLRYRFNWTFPIHYSRHDPDVLWVCSQHLHRSRDNGASWEVVSPDLTRNDKSRLKPSGGPVTRDNTGAEVYCTIFALAESPQRRNWLWCGTDDGLVHRSRDGGKRWDNITPDGRNAKVDGAKANALPEWALISIVEASPHHQDACYVAATRYKLDDTRPYLYKTADGGKSWTKITGDIPDGEFTRTIREDPSRRGLLYCGTETGIYVSFDDGGQWHRLGGNLPVAPIYDLVVKGVEMVVATHGRSIWILDDLTPFHQLYDLLREKKGGKPAAHLFQPRSRVRMRVIGGFGGIAAQATASRGPAWPGMISYPRTGTNVIRVLPLKQPDGSYDNLLLDSGRNPPYGVVVQYYLPDKPKGGASLTFLDEKGRELRHYAGVPAEPGVNRFLWNRRLDGAPNVLAKDLEPWNRPDGAMVVPGRYAVRLTVDGDSRTQPFEIERDPRVKTRLSDLKAQFVFLGEIIARLTAVNTMINDVDALLAQLALLDRRAGGRAAVRDGAAKLAAELRAIRGALIDVHYPGAQLYASGLHEKLNGLFDTVDSGDFAPAQQTRDVYAVLSAELDALTTRWQRVRDKSLPALNAAMAQSGLAAIG